MVGYGVNPPHRPLARRVSSWPILLQKSFGSGRRIGFRRGASNIEARQSEPRGPPQSPAPGLGEKYWSLSGLPSHSLESGGGAFLTVIFGQALAYSPFS